MDEGTSHLDASREAAINAVVERMGVSRLIIAHRAETIAAAGRVLAVEDGRLVDIAPERGGGEAERPRIDPPARDTDRVDSMGAVV
jgi:ABC-type bacteriocin/lantibiotic exporter with double-glycine peptidase domain